MAGGAAITVVTKSGTNTLKGSAFYFRNQDELNADTPRVRRSPGQAEFEHHHRRRNGWRADREEQAVLLRGHREQSTNATAGSTSTPFRPRRCATATSAKCSRSTRTSTFTTRRPATRTAPAGRSSRARSFRRTASAPSPSRSRRSIRRRTIRARTTGCRTTCSSPATRRPIRDNYDFKVNWNRTHLAPDLREVLDDAGERGRHLLPGRDPSRRRQHEGVCRRPSATRGRSARRWCSTATSA